MVYQLRDAVFRLAKRRKRRTMAFMSDSGHRSFVSNRRITALLVAVLGSIGAGSPAQALETGLQYVLTLTGDVERLQVEYSCDGREELLVVEYVNAAPNFLAILAVEDGEPLVFANVISASGARYAAGTYEWWTKGVEANLLDAALADPDAPPLLSCLEFNNIP